MSYWVVKKSGCYLRVVDSYANEADWGTEGGYFWVASRGLASRLSRKRARGIAKAEAWTVAKVRPKRRKPKYPQPVGDAPVYSSEHTIMVGDGCVAVAPDESVTVVAGDKGTAIAQPYGTALAGRKGGASVVTRGVALVGDGGLATGGDYSLVVASDGGVAAGGVNSRVVVGADGIAQGDEGSVLAFFWRDAMSGPWSIATGYVGEGGLEPNVPYVVRRGKIVRRDSVKL